VGQGNFKFVFSVMLSTHFHVLEKALVLYVPPLPCTSSPARRACMCMRGPETTHRSRPDSRAG
jgi:hypothetical protein